MFLTWLYKNIYTNQVGYVPDLAPPKLPAPLHNLFVSRGVAFEEWNWIDCMFAFHGVPAAERDDVLPSTAGG